MVAIMNILVTHAAEDLPPRRAFTALDISRMVDAGVLSENERIELIEGEIVVMSAKGFAHELIKSALNMAIVRAAPDAVSVGVEMTIQFTDRTILEPDLVVFERKALIKSEANFSQLRSGGLLLAIEVAVSSLNYDRKLKSLLYAGFGVQEFWVVDANERVTWKHTAPRENGWASVVKLGPDDTLTTSALPGFALRLADID
jgi:Uma2 family endonuclease